MFPRLTSGPYFWMNHACERVVGASKTMSARSSSWTISSIRPVRMSPVERKIPAVPPSRPSVITFQAPASRSSFSHCTHW